MSLMESLLDFQFEFLTTYYNSKQDIKRSQVNNGNPMLGAPYGIYQTANGYIAIAMMDIHVLGNAVDCCELLQYAQKNVFVNRDEIKGILNHHLQLQPTKYWLEKLQAKDLWAMEVLDWNMMVATEAYQKLQMEQVVTAANGQQITTTTCPIRINGQKLFASKAAPALGANNSNITKEFIK
jgi:crotonobetainyl-CoA:carnitine CoA-transferase CaiB-like acyl-CoA transferase